MRSGHVFVLGGGVAGLASATLLAEEGQNVTLIEAAPQAGGRCRSFYDKHLEADVDNGNHLVLSGNVDSMRYLRRIDALETIDILPAHFPYRDINTGESWSIDLGKRRLLLRALCPKHRIPGTKLMDYWRSRAVLSASENDTVAQALKPTAALYDKFWAQFAVSVLNTKPEEASARLLAPVIRETLLKGGLACRPVLAKRGLGFSFVEPALTYLERSGVNVLLRKRCRRADIQEGWVVSLDIDGEKIFLNTIDTVISALPPTNTKDIFPHLTVPDDFRSIVNGHFKISETAYTEPITGLQGGLVEWLFLRGNMASITISAADKIVDEPADMLAKRIWREIATILGMGSQKIPLHRIIKEKRATIAQTPEMVTKRPKALTEVENLLLAGDWTDTGLPATIEGAIRSGHLAAKLALNR